MRFLARSLTGLLLTALTLALIGYGAVRLSDSMKEAEARKAEFRPAPERVYDVQTVVAATTRIAPVLTAYGEIESARRLELRAARAGELSDISPVFRDGGRVTQGELLFRVDPSTAESNLARAGIALSEARAETEDAATALELAVRELAAAEVQRDLQATALARQEDLKRRGVGASTAVENAKLALSAANQSALAREQAIALARSRLAKSDIELRRARLAVADSRRELQETSVHAPFDGLLTETSAVLGRRVNAGEKLGVLIDPAAFEAAFRVSNAEYARLLDEAGRLTLRDVVVTLDLGDAVAKTAGRLARSGAATGEALTGRMLYARLDPDDAGVLREGDFVAVAIEEPELVDVAVLPATAVTEDGRLLIVDENERLVEVGVAVKRRMGNLVAVVEAPIGAHVVARRKPQLGAGVKVRPRPLAAGELGASPDPALDMVELSPDRRGRLSATVESDASLSLEEKARLLAHLAEGRLPRADVERLEDRAAAADERSRSGG